VGKGNASRRPRGDGRAGTDAAVHREVHVHLSCERVRKAASGRAGSRWR
jgi:hypothetical protein